MNKFGLACEGITDHIVLENILCGYFEDFPDLDEDTVNCAGATLADLHFRLGYRREHEDE